MGPNGPGFPPAELRIATGIGGRVPRTYQPDQSRRANG